MAVPGPKALTVSPVSMHTFRALQAYVFYLLQGPQEAPVHSVMGVAVHSMQDGAASPG